MLKWCPCMRWCLSDPSSGGEAKVLLNSMTTPAYNVRRISSFGQTVINDAGEEEEVCRHGTIPKRVENDDGPPWTANTIPVQPGVTKSEVAARIQRMTSIPEATTPKSQDRLKKSFSESDRCSVESPLRTRKKIHTPQEFAEVTFHRNNDCDDGNSTTSETNSERSNKRFGSKSFDLPDLTSSKDSLHNTSDTNTPTEKKQRSMSAAPSSQFLMMKAKNGSIDKVESPWPKKKFEKTHSTLPRMKGSPVGKFKQCRSVEEVIEVKRPYTERSIDENNSIDDDNYSISKESVFDEDEDSATVSHSPSQSTVQMGEDAEEAQMEGSRSTESAEIAKQYGLDLNLYDLNTSKAFMDSSDFDLSATTSIAWIGFSAQLNKEKNELTVRVINIEGLGGQGSENKNFDVVVKLGFIKGGHVYSTKPSPSSKPIEQSFSLHIRDFSASILRLSVYNSAWQGQHDALGHTLFRINKCSEYATQHTLAISPRSNVLDSAAIIEVSYRYEQNTLHIIVHKVFDILPAYRAYKIYVKVSLFISSKKIKEKMTKAESGEKGYTVYDFESKFKAENLSAMHGFVMLSLKKKSENGKLFKHDKTLGRVFLGPLFYTGKKINFWGQAVLNAKIITNNLSFYL